MVFISLFVSELGKVVDAPLPFSGVVAVAAGVAVPDVAGVVDVAVGVVAPVVDGVIAVGVAVAVPAPPLTV